MNIIAFRTFHFRQHDIVKDEKTGELSAILKKEILVPADTRAQVVPDWVADDEFFQMAAEDGTIQQVDFVKQKKKPTLDNRPKVNVTGIPRATFADPNEEAEFAETGKIAQPKFDKNTVPLTGQSPAGNDWPKAADKNNAGLAG